MPNALRLSLGLLGVLSLPGCHSPNHPSANPPDPVAPLALSCPSNLQLANVKAPTQTVDFTAPGHTGGVEPVSMSCSPASGSAFPLGPTTVECNGTDAASPPRTAACSFIVTLVPNAPTPVVGATRFMAFGDSITAGEVNDDTDRTCNPGPTFAPLGRPQEVLSDLSYPTQLQQLLAARYTTQSITVANEGVPNSLAADTDRFGAAIRADGPDAILLLQGIVDLGNPEDIPGVIDALRTDVEYAKGKGIDSLFLSTLLPVGPGFRACGRQNVDIQSANDQIRALAASEGVYLVDSYVAFKDRMDTLMGSDGLHPTAEGYKVLAQTFFEVIKFRLETAPADPVPAAARPSALARPNVQIRPPAKR